MSELSEGRDASSLCLFCTKKGVYMKNNIRIYEIKSEYIKCLSTYQEHIFDQADGKGNRKYIGIVLEVKGVKYFAPLSSYKDKHKKMKESVDFIKIKDYAVINLNNMIPVPENQIINIDINKEKNPNYKYLLQAESREVNRQKNRIRKNAEIVYIHKKHNGKKTALAKRTKLMYEIPFLEFHTQKTWNFSHIRRVIHILFRFLKKYCIICWCCVYVGG